MAESLYRRSPKDIFTKTVQGRSKLLNEAQTIGGKSIQMVNPAWIQITGVCNMCSGKVEAMTLPKEKGNWDDLYKINGLKPSPILENVTITYGGDWGLAQKLTANIKCFDLDTFDAVRKAFLMPGNEISAEFGYSTSNQWNSPEQEHNTVVGFRVAVFSFSAGDDGTWIGSFTAVSSAEAIKSIDLMQGLSDDGLKYDVAGNMESKERVEVKSIAELVASDAQRNGSESLNRVTDSKSGYVISDFAKYDPTDRDTMQASMVLYTSKHLYQWGKISEAGASIRRYWKRYWNTWDEAEHTIHQVYVTLGYIVDRVINDKIKKSVESAILGDDLEKFKKLKIRFHKEFSQSRLPPLVESGDPLSVLILGDGVGYFKGENGREMSFNHLRGQDEGKQEHVRALTGLDLRLDKILIHRDVMMGALGDATDEKVNESETVDPKDTQDTVINLNDFFKKIFSIIKECTGGALALRLVYDPDDESRETLLVVDQNYGGDSEIPCFIFNPIDGDGSTISCNISSNGGSGEYRTSMYLANSKKGDVAARMRNCEPELDDGRKVKRGKAEDRYGEIVLSPGHMLSYSFSEKQIDALKGVMVDLTRYSGKAHEPFENVHWPGMTIELKIHGAWGIIPGCAIMTTQAPVEWRVGGKNIYFMVTEVTHNFNQSVWTTDIRGIMSFYDNLTEVKL